MFSKFSWQAQYYFSCFRSAMAKPANKQSLGMRYWLWSRKCLTTEWQTSLSMGGGKSERLQVVGGEEGGEGEGGAAEEKNWGAGKRRLRTLFSWCRPKWCFLLIECIRAWKAREEIYNCWQFNFYIDSSTSTQRLFDVSEILPNY